MHKGSIDSKSAAARVYRALKKRRRPVDGWTLSQAARVTALSTRISEIRQQLPEGETIETIRKVINGEQRFYYLLVRDL